MVFVRRPFDVGDRIAIQEVSEFSDAAGAPGWIVEKVDLYTTTLRYGATRELATVTNGELARKRIVNMQRSKKAVVFIDLKFGVDVTHTQLDQLKSAIQDYVSNRQREWFSMSAFRLTEIHSDLGYVYENAVVRVWTPPLTAFCPVFFL
jgi:small-conductance mechanosensitive channel